MAGRRRYGYRTARRRNYRRRRPVRRSRRRTFNKKVKKVIQNMSEAKYITIRDSIGSTPTNLNPIVQEMIVIGSGTSRNQRIGRSVKLTKLHMNFWVKAGSTASAAVGRIIFFRYKSQRGASALSDSDATQLLFNHGSPAAFDCVRLRDPTQSDNIQVLWDSKVGWGRHGLTFMNNNGSFQFSKTLFPNCYLDFNSSVDTLPNRNQIYMCIFGDGANASDNYEWHWDMKAYYHDI